MVVWQGFCGVNGETHSREPDLSMVLKNSQRKFEALKFMIPVFHPIFSFGRLARFLCHERGNTCMGTRLICGLGKRPCRKFEELKHTIPVFRPFFSLPVPFFYHSRVPWSYSKRSKPWNLQYQSSVPSFPFQFPLFPFSSSVVS